jgi:hypothetical protein
MKYSNSKLKLDNTYIEKLMTTTCRPGAMMRIKGRLARTGRTGDSTDNSRTT